MVMHEGATEIANLALSHAKSKLIDDLRMDTSPQARLARQFYDPALEAALEAYDWSFARRFAKLAASGEEPQTNWSYSYVLPEDCIAPRWILSASDPNDNRTPFTVVASAGGQQRLLQTNRADAELRYTFRQFQTTMYTPNFVISLSHRLAAYIAFAQTGKASIRDAQLEQAFIAERIAKGADANANQKDEPPPDADWIQERTN